MAVLAINNRTILIIDQEFNLMRDKRQYTSRIIRFMRSALLDLWISIQLGFRVAPWWGKGIILLSLAFGAAQAALFQAPFDFAVWAVVAICECLGVYCNGCWTGRIKRD